MGNIKSLNEHAYMYITNQTTKDSQKLCDINYCNELLTKLTLIIKQNYNINDLKIIYGNLYNSNDTIVEDISKYYIKLAHLISVITGTNNINECSLRINTLINKFTREQQNIKLELEELYYDVYNIENNEFDNMSLDMKKTYKNDLSIFYKSFTGGNLPININKFSDIDLSIYHTTPDLKSDNLLIKYANHIRYMLKKSNHLKTELTNIINKLIVNNEIVHDVKLLDECIEKTRQLIINQQLTCKDDYIKGLQLFEAIVELQFLKISRHQINHLETLLTK